MSHKMKMTRNSMLIVILVFSLLPILLCIKVSENWAQISIDGHYFRRNREPFLWLGDTGWTLFTLSSQDVDYYFSNRVQKQFNVIQMMVTRRMFNEPDFLPNYRGDVPFESLNPVKLDEAYFSHIDTIVQLAKEHHLLLAMAPTWGTVLDQIFSVHEPSKAYDFGRLLGERYKNERNVIWIVCGEYHKIAWDKEKPDNRPDSLELALIQNLAKGLLDGSEGNNLMTIHPTGWKSSSDHFHNAPWLDFNMIQTYSIGSGTEFLVRNDFERRPIKPTVLAEPGYEFGGAGHVAFDLRYEAYHALCDGAAGFTYGCQGVWNFAENWKELLDSEGAGQMKYLAALFASRPMQKREPFPELIGGKRGKWKKREKTAACRSSDGSYAFVYFPGDSRTHKINLKALAEDRVNAWWFNPRTGSVCDAEGISTNRPFAQLGKNLEKYAFDPPGNHGAGYDWVLVLDDAARGFKSPGSF